jgi:hypothetical protein
VSQPVDQNHANEEDLTAFALRPETVEKSIVHHITQCEKCISAVNNIVMLQRALKTKLSRFDCPSAEKLVDYLYGRLSFEEHLEVREHVRNCLRCTGEIQVTQQASEMFAPASLWQTVSRVVASRVLTSPQRGSGLQYSLRDIEDEGAPYQIFQSFVAGDIEVNLGHYQVEPGTFLLTGRISQKQSALSAPLLFTPLAVRLLRIAADQPSELIDERPLEPDNFFELAPVPPGTYQLEVLLSDRLVEIGELKL